MSAQTSPRKHRGITLGYGCFPDHPETTWFRVRVGRELALVTVARLTRDWLDAYLLVLRAAGKDDQARELRRVWLSTSKNRRMVTP